MARYSKQKNGYTVHYDSLEEMEADNLPPATGGFDPVLAPIAFIITLIISIIFISKYPAIPTFARFGLSIFAATVAGYIACKLSEWIWNTIALVILGTIALVVGSIIWHFV